MGIDGLLSRAGVRARLDRLVHSTGERDFYPHLTLAA